MGACLGSAAACQAAFERFFGPSIAIEMHVLELGKRMPGCEIV
jgi:hypothetical protein